MALEIDFESAHEMPISELLDFVARQSGGELLDAQGTPYFRTAGMDVSPYAIDTGALSEEEDRHTAQTGFRRRTLVTFRERGRSTEEERLAGWVMLLNLVLEFLRRYPDDALLVYNGERVLLRHRGKETVFDAWEGFEDEPALAAIVSRHVCDQLEQPFL